MSEFILDLTQYKDRMGANVPEGRYLVVVEDAEMDKSKAGNPMINLWFRILDGEQKDLVLTDRLVMTEKSLFRIVGFMQSIGLPTPNKRLKLNLKQFLNKTLMVDVADGEPYNGRVRSEVKGYIRPAKGSGGGGESAPSEDLPEPEAVTPAEGAVEAAAEPAPAAEEAAPAAGTPAEPEEINLDEIDLG